MPQPPAAVVGGNSWLAAPPAAAYEIGLYCARVYHCSVSWLGKDRHLSPWPHCLARALIKAVVTVNAHDNDVTVTCATHDNGSGMQCP